MVNTTITNKYFYAGNCENYGFSENIMVVKGGKSGYIENIVIGSEKGDYGNII